MLVQLALIVFGMFGILAAIVDVGFVRLAQAQMQGAADSAAVEGLRGRDSQMVDGQLDGFASDCMRRLAARDFVRWTFDDDINANNGDPRSFGAGPNIKFTDGAGDVYAYQFMSVPADDDPDPALRGRAYKPVLQSNQAGNVHYGDMVSGRFDSTINPLDGVPGRYEGPNQDRTVGAYVRQDLAPGLPPPPGDSGLPDCPADSDESLSSTDSWSNQAPGAGYSGSGQLSDGAFLVRLRRTPNLGGLDEEQSVSSRGSGLPLLFARGTLIQPNPGSDYQPRRDGITVRATAIADARAVMRIGADAGLTARRIWITRDTLATLPVTVNGMTGEFAGGAFTDPALMITVGDPSPASAASAPVACDPASLAVTIRGAVLDTTLGNVVVGFAGFMLTWTDCASDPVLTLMGTPVMAAGNATALLDASFAGDAALMAAVATFTGPPPAYSAGVLLAPVLVR